jgi:hypothetical protein
MMRVRVVGTPEAVVHEAALEHAVPLESDEVLLSGRIELLRYVQEQARSVRYHRFGNLAGRALLSKL